MTKRPGQMFDPNDQVLHFGDVLSLSSRLDAFKPVERYFVSACNKRQIFYTYDMSAEEFLYFTTLNYTTYAGLFIMHPHQTELAMRQMFDALRDQSIPRLDFSGYLKRSLETGTANKYEMAGRPNTTPHKVVVVLPGSNRIETHISLNKLKWIVKQHGQDVLFKPHPLTPPDIIECVIKDIGVPASQFADPNTDLYQIIKHADIVYTSHLSESAAYAALLGKKVDPIDEVRSRNNSSFTHINYLFFTEDNHDEWVDTAFSSPKSGVVHPDIDKDWKGKIDQYLDYILAMRDKFKTAYINEKQS